MFLVETLIAFLHQGSVIQDLLEECRTKGVCFGEAQRPQTSHKFHETPPLEIMSQKSLKDSLKSLLRLSWKRHLLDNLRSYHNSAVLVIALIFLQEALAVNILFRPSWPVERELGAYHQECDIVRLHQSSISSPSPAAFAFGQAAIDALSANGQWFVTLVSPLFTLSLFDLDSVHQDDGQMTNIRDKPLHQNFNLDWVILNW